MGRLKEQRRILVLCLADGACEQKKGSAAHSADEASHRGERRLRYDNVDVSCLTQNAGCGYQHSRSA